MAEPQDFELKLGRAKQRLQELDVGLGLWLESHTNTVDQWDDPEDSTQIVVTFTPEPAPRDPHAIAVAEVLHNLRSALDNLVYALAVSNAAPSQITDVVAEKSEFPIVGDKNRRGILGSGQNLFNTVRGDKIGGIHREAQAIIESLQPYKAGAAFERDPLFWLHDLDRVCKHRLIPLWDTFYVVLPPDFRYSINRGFTKVEIREGKMNDETGEVEGTLVVISKNPVDGNVQVEIDSPVQVVFGDTVPCVQAQPVVPTLATIYNHVVIHVVPPLAKFLT